MEKFFIRLFLISTLIPLQSCSNTLIGEKLEKSFDTSQNRTLLENLSKVKELKKVQEIKQIELSRMVKDTENQIIKEKIIEENAISNKKTLSQKAIKTKKKVIFNPQPYRIILKLSGANPSAPAETVTKALRKAGVQFEVEKIERFDEEILLKNSSLQRKGL